MIDAKIQYRIGTHKIMLKYCNGIGTNPMYSPINVNGIIIATILKIIDVAYTALDALL